MTPCSFKSCSNEAVYMPVLICPGPPDDLKLELDLRICEFHRGAPVNAFISDDGWAHIKNLLQDRGRKPAHRDDIEIEFETSAGLVVEARKTISPLE